MPRNSVGRWIESLKGPGFTTGEVRAFCVLVLCIAPIALAFVLAFGHDLAPNEDLPGLGGDFPAFYLAGRLLNEHAPSELYDLRLQERLFHDVRPTAHGLRLPYLHPPHVAVLFRPLALLPYGWAFAAWSALSLAAYAAGLLVMTRRFGPTNAAARVPALLLGLSFEPFLVETLAGGQLSSIGFTCLALALTSEQKGQHFVSGLFVSLCAYKPTLLVFVLPMLVISRRWRALLGFVTGMAALIVVSFAAFGASVLADYVRTTVHFGQLYVGSAVLRTWKFVDIRAFATMLTGSDAAGLLVAVAGAGWALPRLVRAWWLAGLGRTRQTAGLWALTLVWTLLLGLHAPIYDTILVALVFILLASADARRRDIRYEPALQWLLLWTIGAAWISQVAARIVGFQVFTLILLFVALYADRRLQEQRGAEQCLACRRGLP